MSIAAEIGVYGLALIGLFFIGAIVIGQIIYRTGDRKMSRTVTITESEDGYAIEFETKGPTGGSTGGALTVENLSKVLAWLAKFLDNAGNNLSG